MSKSSKHLKWLQSQLPIWQEHNYVTPENAGNIHNLYEAQESRFHWSLVVFAIFGAVLIGGGMTMIFGHNWDLLSRGTKAAIALLIALSGQSLAGFVLYKNKSVIWRESSAVFLNLALLCSISIIGQTYQLGGNLEKLLFWWLIMSFPACLLLKSTAALLLYVAVIPCWLIEFTNNNPHEALRAAGLLTIVSLPIIYDVIKSWVIFYKNGEGRIISTTSFISFICILGCFGGLTGVDEKIIFTTLSTLAFGAIFAELVRERISLPVYLNPLAAVATLPLFFIFTALSFKDLSSFIMSQRIVEGVPNLIVFIMVIGVMVYSIIKRNKICALLASLPVVFYTFCQLNSQSWSLITCAIIINLIIVFLSVAIIQEGEKERKPLFSFIGIFWLSVIIFLRFVDSNLPLFGKGVGFIITGLLFLASNIFMTLKIKSKNREV